MSERLPSHREVEILGILIHGRKYGREIREEYQRRTGRTFPLGSLYTTLDRMEAKGLLKSQMGDASSERGGNRRRYFKLTAPGTRAFNAATEWAAGLAQGGQVYGGR